VLADAPWGDLVKDGERIPERRHHNCHRREVNGTKENRSIAAKNVNHGLGEVTNNHLHLNFSVLGLLLGQPQSLRVSQFCTLDHYWTFQPISYKMFAFGSSKEIEAK
jgi:hypothetical protein